MAKKFYLAFLFLFALSNYSSAQVTIRTNLLFETGKHDLSSEHSSKLDSILKSIEGRPIEKIELSGHTDNEGNSSFNLNLSEKRTNSVKEYFVSNKIDPNLITSRFYGEKLPVGTDKRQNRRTEIVIVLKKEVSIDPCDPLKILGLKYNLDLDEDGVDDFTVHYNEAPSMIDRGGQPKRDPTKKQPIFAYLKSARKHVATWMDHSFVYVGSGGGFVGIKDLQPGNTIYTIKSNEKGTIYSKSSVSYTDRNADYAWSENSPHNTLITYNPETNRWESTGKTKTNIRYVGFMIVTKEGNYKVGYLKIEFDYCTGLIKILDKKLSDDSSILVVE
jgi:hypothetical protein